MAMDELTARRTADFVTFADIKLLGIPYCRAHLYRMIRAGEFLDLCKLGPGRVAFRQADLREWIQSRPST